MIILIAFFKLKTTELGGRKIFFSMKDQCNPFLSKKLLIGPKLRLT